MYLLERMYESVYVYDSSTLTTQNPYNTHININICVMQIAW